MKGQIMKFNHNFYHSKIIIFLFLIKISLLALTIKSDIRILSSYYSEIHLVIQGSGEQQLIYNTFNPAPSEVLINGIKDDSCERKCTLTGDKSNITLRFNEQLTSCEKMFRGLTNLKEIDLTNFDTSKVETMHQMFYGCTTLTSVDMSNLNTLKVNRLRSMFEGCSKLEHVDLTNFDTSSVTEMLYCV